MSCVTNYHNFNGVKQCFMVSVSENPTWCCWDFVYKHLCFFLQFRICTQGFPLARQCCTTLATLPALYMSFYSEILRKTTSELVEVLGTNKFLVGNFLRLRSVLCDHINNAVKKHSHFLVFSDFSLWYQLEKKKQKTNKKNFLQLRELCNYFRDYTLYVGYGELFHIIQQNCVIRFGNLGVH
jgi:hypothetical protein